MIEHAFILETEKQLSLQSLPEGALIAVGALANGALAGRGRSADDVEDDGDDGAAWSNRQSPARAGHRIPAPERESEDGDGSDGDEESDAADDAAASLGERLDFNRHKEAFEREFIVKALKTFKGRINQTALHANIPKKTLLRKIEKYGINARDYIEPKSPT